MADKKISLPSDDGEDVTYLPGEGDPHTVKWRGVEFKAHLPVRITREDILAAARTNRFFWVGAARGGAPGSAPISPPTTAMEYRAHVVDWSKSVESVDQLVSRWAADRQLRATCEVGQDDIDFLGTLVEPKLRSLRMKEGLSEMDVAGLWVKRGVLDLPWRA